MAEENEREFENDISRPKNDHQLLNSWLLDYARHEAFIEFKTKKTITETDFIQGVLQKCSENENAKMLVHMLMLMCKVINGEDYSTRFIPNSELTVLEEILPSFDIIIANFPSPSPIRKTSSKFRVEIMKQAVYVCCRAGDFEMASEVFQRQWTDLEESEKAHKSAVQTIIKQRNQSHPTLKKQTFSKFLDSMVDFLQPVHNTFPEPFLLKISKAYIGISRDIAGDSPNKRTKYNLKDLKCMLSPASVSNLQKKLNKHREKTVMDVVSSSMEDTNNSNMEDTNDVPSDEDSEVEINMNGGSAKTTPSRTSRRVSDQNETRRTPSRTSRRVSDQHGARSPGSLLYSMRKRRFALENATQKLGKTVETCNSPVKRKRNGSVSSLNKSSEKSEDESETESPKDIRKHRYGKNKNRVDRHQPSASDQSEQSGPSDSSESSDIDISDDESPKKAESSTKLPMAKLNNRKKVTCRLSSPQRRKQLKKANWGVESPPQKRIKWTSREEAEFYKMVQTHGAGNWNTIRLAMKTFRTNMNLKDKWRNLNKSHMLPKFESKYGKYE